MLPIPKIKVPEWVIDLAAVVVVVGVIALGLWWYGDSKYEQGRTDLLAEQAQAAVLHKEAQGKITERVVTKYVDRIVTVREKGDTIIRRVPVYVTAQDDSRCTINNGFVRLWNEANTGEVSEPSAGADAAPSGVVLSEVATQKGYEAKLCRETEQRLVSLQEWVLEQQALSERR